MMNTKSICYDLKDFDDQKGVVVFYFSIFDHKDSDGDIVVKGAFNKTVKENFNRIKHTKNHNTTQIPGVVQEIAEDNVGEWAKSKFILGTQIGKETYEEYKAGAITEHSFGYDVIKHTDDKEKEARVLSELKLYEVASLTFLGANWRTGVIDIKSEKDINKLISELDLMLKLKRGDFRDEKLQNIENRINEILKHIVSLKEKPGDTQQEPTLTLIEPSEAVKYLRENCIIFK